METEPQDTQSITALLTKDTKVRRKVRMLREIVRGEPPKTLTQTRALRALLLLTQSIGLKAGEYECPRETLRDMLNIRDDSLLEEELFAIRGKTWDWPGLSSAEGWVTPIPNLRMEKGSPTIRWEISKMFVDLLGHVGPRGYIYEAWDVIAEFTSLYSLRIWEICTASVHSSGFDSTTPKMSLSELRVKLGVPSDAYRGEGQSGALLHFAVKKPLDEVLKVGGLDVVFEREGRGEKAFFWFRIRGRKPRQPSLPQLAPGSAARVRRVEYDLKKRIQAALNALNPADRKTVETWMSEKEKYSKIPDDELNLRSYAGRIQGVPGVKVTIPERVD